MMQNSNAQLTLERIDGGQITELPVEMEISLKMPTQTTREQCDCYQLYKGILKKYDGDTAILVLKETSRIYYDENDVARKERVQYGYMKQEVETSIPTKNLLAVTKYPKGRKSMDTLGGFLMMLSAFQGLVVGPFLSDDVRSVSDKIVWGTFGAGFILAVLPNKKTYYLQQPKGKYEPLWRLGNP